jgi:hypothetical protein
MQQQLGVLGTIPAFAYRHRETNQKKTQISLVQYHCRSEFAYLEDVEEKRGCTIRDKK